MKKSIVSISVLALFAMVACVVIELTATETETIEQESTPPQVYIEEYIEEFNDNTFYEDSSNDDLIYQQNERIQELQDQIDNMQSEKQEQSSVSNDAPIVYTIEPRDSEPKPIIEEQSSQSGTNAPQDVTLCDECGHSGELHKDIMKWMSTDGDNNYTHWDCTQNYVNRTGKQPKGELGCLD